MVEIDADPLRAGLFKFIKEPADDRFVEKRQRRLGYRLCQGCEPGTEELTIDHVTPRCRGGRSTWKNCVLACVSCNKRKANRTVRRAGMRLRKLPKAPNWSWDVEVSVAHRRASWEQFLADRYWNVELDAD